MAGFLSNLFPSQSNIVPFWPFQKEKAASRRPFGMAMVSEGQATEAALLRR
jgi:hypothetical protein